MNGWRRSVYALLVAASSTLALGIDACPRVSPGPYEDTSSSLLLPGVVVSPERSVVYVMKPGGGLEAIDIGSGTVAWETSRAARPLAAYGSHLVAQVEASAGSALGLVVIDRDSGGSVVHERTVPLPDGVRAIVSDSLGESFAADAHVEDGVIVVSWRYSRQVVRGVRPPPGPRGERFESRGVVRIDLASGDVGDSVPGAAETSPLATVPEQVLRLADRTKLLRPPWRAGDIVAAVQRGEDGAEHMLKRWRADTGEALADISLGTNVRAIKNVSADGKHLLTSTSKGADSTGWQRHEWSAVSVATGRRVTPVECDFASARFVVMDDLLLRESRPHRRRVGGKMVEHPLGVEALDVASGETLWERRVRDTSYRGSLPPERRPFRAR